MQRPLLRSVTIKISVPVPPAPPRGPMRRLRPPAGHGGPIGVRKASGDPASFGVATVSGVNVYAADAPGEGCRDAVGTGGVAAQDEHARTSATPSTRAQKVRIAVKRPSL